MKLSNTSFFNGISELIKVIKSLTTLISSLLNLFLGDSGTYEMIFFTKSQNLPRFRLGLFFLGLRV